MNASIEAKTAAVIRRFNDAFQLHDPSLLDDLIAADCVLENSTPAPNGSRGASVVSQQFIWYVRAITGELPRHDTSRASRR